MSTVGLTKAMRDGLELASRGYIDLIKRPTWVRLREAELVDLDGKLTPRGHAAWVAPRMTPGEFHYMNVVMNESTPSPDTAMAKRIIAKGWGQCSPSAWWVQFTPAGRTALNNVRAAMGSPDWKEGL